MRTRTSLMATLVALVFLGGALAPPEAEAQRRGAKQAQKRAPVNEAALAELMGPFKFGMTRNQIIRVLTKQIGERFAEQIAATSDVYRQDQLRKERDREIKRVHDSYVEFKGDKSGWDVSIIDDQFRHETSEAMMVFWENTDGRDQRRFFFFFEGKLYKMVIALNFEGMGDINFARLEQIMTNRFGPGQVGFVERDDMEFPATIDWRSPKYHARAIDKLEFYGTFALMIADPKGSAQVEQARARRPQRERRTNVVQQMTSGEGDAPPPLDGPNSNVVDRLIRGN
jgi:hypothetical protein